jgi:hypothetical protein
MLIGLPCMAPCINSTYAASQQDPKWLGVHGTVVN